ncbi:hypothetical protein DL766_001518 [Monosporascus sp. MC13-8B]|uniref:Uncharacterized protein n=1 Tax=Monosporascus cannonballus TaxID=155416 RepID=A0ABY0H1M5_9PEZI|nr:hypothetical protein DL762_006579 [Monosporascus cannonballus]RYO99855.1 hypothetical protein DL763_001245 [Monosporascus cannonballus]RYP37524.1 hypothetical protein DL766_001518 [Monosporascus sp. MC13-8B]
MAIKGSTHVSRTDFAVLTDSRTNRVDEGPFDTKAPGMEDDPQEHRPEPKWSAPRLKIPNELRLRLLSWFGRPKASEVASDAKGNPFVGVKKFALGDEIWVHYSLNP